jgi:hypothetical protein
MVTLEKMDGEYLGMMALVEAPMPEFLIICEA